MWSDDEKKGRGDRMSQQTRKDSGLEPHGAGWIGPSEPESHSEHLAALDATLFRRGAEIDELVIELDSGELRIQRRV